MTSTALLVLNPREIPDCIAAMESLDLPTGWCSYMPEILVAEALNRCVRETEFDRYVVISDDAAPTRAALDAVLALHDEIPDECVTGYCNLDMDPSNPFVNLTYAHARLHRPPPTVEAYVMLTESEARRHAGPIRTTFAGLCLTVMSREMWLRFPLRCSTLGGQMDYVLSWELQQSGVPIWAPPDGFVLHVKEKWNLMDTNPQKQLLVGVRSPEVTWTEPGERLKEAAARQRVAGAAEAVMPEDSGGVSNYQTNADVERDWLGRPKDPEIERLRALGVDECVGCGPGGIYVRYCPIHGLHGTAPR